jgi:predicted nucleic acid-binding protein
LILLDTNVLAELMRATPAAEVEQWLARQPQAGLFICAITVAELRHGVALLPAGRRRSALAIDIENMFFEDLAGRILPFDSAAAVEFAAIASDRRRAGRPISLADAQIAAIARSRAAALATRNVADFEGRGVELVNPWEAART